MKNDYIDPLDFNRQLSAVADQYPLLRIINEDGSLENEALFDTLNLSEKELTEIMERMVWARTYNERSEKLAKQGRLGFHGPGNGQEASQIGSIMAFNRSDYMLSGYRDIPQMVFHGAPLGLVYLWSLGHVKGNQYPEGVEMIPPQIILGAQIVQAAGVGLGLRKRGKEQVAFTFIGDGGTSQGDFYEGLNFAGVYKANLVVFVINNGYAISTPREKQTAAPTLAQKAAATGIPGIQVDGMDPLAVLLAARHARAWSIEGKGPVLIEALTSRFGPHSLSGDDPSIYRTQESFEYWSRRDPLPRYRRFLSDRGIWSEAQEEAAVAEATEDVQQAITFADEAPEQKVSEFLRSMFEEPTAEIAEQIAYYEAKEKA